MFQILSPQRIHIIALRCVLFLILSFVASSCSSHRYPPDEVFNKWNLVQHDDFYAPCRQLGTLKFGERFRRCRVDITDTAETMSRVRMRANPSPGAAIIRTLEPKTRVRFGQRSGDWFEIWDFKGQSGWINGKYLRPLTPEERTALLGKGIKMVLHYTFPEKTIIGKILGFLGGLIISILSSIIIRLIFQEAEYLELFVGIAPLSYFIAKNQLMTTIPTDAFFACLAASVFITLILSIPTDIIVRRIME